MRKEVDVCGTRLQAGRFPQAIRDLEGHVALLSDFVTQTFPLQQVQEAFAFVTENPASVRKAVVLMED